MAKKPKSEQGVPDDCPLWTSEFQVLRRLCDGKTYQEIARERNVAFSTVRTQLHTAYVKLGVTNGTQAITAMFRNGWLGWVPPPESKPGPKPRPLSPFALCYLSEFDGYLAAQTSTQSEKHRDGMRLALLGMRHERATANAA